MSMILEQNKQKSIQDFISSGMPKVSIQTATLETSALTNDTIYSIDGVSGTSRVKDPHIMQNITDFPTDQSANNLKITLTLSLQGFLQKSTKLSAKASGLWFDDVNLASMVTVKVYQIDEAFWNGMKGSPALKTPSSGVGIKLNDPAVLAYVENMFPADFGTNDGPLRRINVSDILFQADSASKIRADKAKFISTDQNGSTLYNLPITLEPFVLQDLNPGFLAYLVVTEVDPQSMIKSITDTITADLPSDAPGISQLIDFGALTETITDLVQTNAASAVSYDIIFNQKTVNNGAVVLQREDNGHLWFGNWHAMPDGTLMTGQVHNDPNLPIHNKNVILNPIEVVNTKIVDLRDDEEIEKIFLQDLYQIDNVYDKMSQINKQPRRKDGAYKTELPEGYSFDCMSSHSDGTFSGLICLDKNKILLDKSMHSNIAKNVINMIGGQNYVAANILETTINNIFLKTKIIDLRVYRKRVRSIGYGQNRLGTPAKSRNNFIEDTLDADIGNSYEDAIPELVATYSDLGTSSGLNKINDVNFLGPGNLLLSFKDASVKSKKKGQYQYYYEVEIEDGIARELQGILKTSLNTYARLKKYVNFIDSNLQKYYNDKLDKFNVNAVVDGYEGNHGDEVNDIIEDCVIRMYKTWCLYGLSNLESGAVDWDMMAKLIKIASPDSGNYQGLIKLFDLFRTLLEKMIKISGCNKDVLDIKLITRKEGNNIIKEFWSPNAGLGTIEKLDSFGSGVKSGENTYKRTISFKETLTGIVNLDQYYQTGYEYLISDIPNADGTSVPLNPDGNIQISSDVFEERVIQEQNKYFSEAPQALNNINMLNIQKYSVTFLGLAKVYLDGQMRSTNMDNFTFSQGIPAVDPRPRIYPYQNNFLFYKDILLDTIRYSMTNSRKDIQDPNATRNQVKKYIEILSPYGVSFLNDLYQQLNFINDAAIPGTSEETDFVDTSESEDTISSLDSANLVLLEDESIGGSLEDEVIDQYMDSLNIGDEYAGKIDFLLSGILGKIITNDNTKLKIYAKLVDFLTETADASGIPKQEETKKIVSTRIPNNIKSLVVTYNPSFSNKKAAAKISDPPLYPAIFEDINRSIETFGWWWFNYSSTVKIMFIDSLDKSLNPVWRTLTHNDYFEHVHAGKNIVCKFVKYTNDNFGVRSNSFLNLPIYNEYFVIKSTKKFI